MSDLIGGSAEKLPQVELISNMKRRTVPLVLGLIVIFTMLPLPSASVVKAQAEVAPLCSADYPASRRVTLVCGPDGDWNGTIFIFNRHQEVDPSLSWQENISQTDAFWIFDARPLDQRGLNGQASLIINFHPEGPGLTADLYDDQNGDGAISYSIPNSSDEPRINESANTYPTVRVSTPENWWAQSSKTNYNLDIRIDGKVRGDFASEISRYYDKFKSDGSADFTIEVRDNNKDGIADYEYRDSPIKGNFIHSSLMVSHETASIPISGQLIWPFLAVSEWGFTQTYNQLSAPIQVNWQSARIITIGEFVPSRGRPSNWFVYSIDRIAKGRSNLTNFESPFAYYDLSNSKDGYPDLQVRFERYNANEFIQSFSEPIQSIRYSWDQYHRHAWDFKIDLLGRQPITSTVPFNDFNIQMVPYEQVPAWTVSKTWDQVNFVAIENAGPFYGSEGIYEWPTQYDTRDSYITGQEDQFSLAPFEQLSVGYRGEYRVAPDSAPKLTINAVDHKLHLFGAQGGFWNIDGQSELQYADMNGDGYIDQWTYSAGGGIDPSRAVTRQLNVSSQYLIYENGKDLIIRQASTKPSLMETMPPTNHDEWLSLGRALDTLKMKIDPKDLQGLMEQFIGPEMQVHNVRMENYRPVGKNSFRFQIEIQPGSYSDGKQLLDLNNLQPGSYVVTYDGALSITPAAPPQLTSEILISGNPQPSQINAVQVRVSNMGLEDVPEATVELWAAPQNGQAVRVGTQKVSLLAQETAALVFDWLPGSAGLWQLSPRAFSLSAPPVNLEPISVNVLREPQRSSAEQSLLGVTSSLDLTIFGLILAAALAAFAFLKRLKPSNGTD